MQIADWNLCPGDVQGILEKAQRVLGVPYGRDEISLSNFHGDPERLPMLFVSGVRTVNFSDDQMAQLRAYVLKGGIVVFDSVAGSPYFTAAARKCAARMFPDRLLRTLPLDHPLFHMVSDVEKARFGRNPPGDTPLLEGVYVGSRVGVLVSPYGLGCGWDDRPVPRLQQAVFYDVDTAVRIGVNLVAYAMGYNRAGLEEAKPELFGAIDEKRPANEFVFAQIRHDAHWDVHPGAAAALLARARQDAGVAVSLKRVAVVPGRDDLSPYTVLYLTGLDDLRFDAAARQALRGFLAGSGTLIINNGLGLATFDAAVRREVAAIIPGAQLKPVPLDHPLFAAAVRVSEASYTPAALKLRPDLKVPYLEGVAIGNDLKIIYSPIDIEAGWDNVDRPLARAWTAAPATAMGLNLITYAVTH